MNCDCGQPDLFCLDHGVFHKDCPKVAHLDLALVQRFVFFNERYPAKTDYERWARGRVVDLGEGQCEK